MTSLFEQYEQAAARTSVYPRGQSSNSQVTTAGFINARAEDDTPIFNKQRISFRPTDTITELVVCNNLIVLAMKNNVLLRIDLLQHESPDEVDVGRHLGERNSESKIRGLHQDPGGQHLIVSVCSKYKDREPVENYYLSRNSKKVRSLTKSKGKLITAMAWNYQTSISFDNSSTGPTLVGTSTGKIYETELICGDERLLFSSSVEQYWKKVFEIKDPECITGIHMQKYPDDSTNRYFILVTTPSRLYQFLGSSASSGETTMLQNIFKDYLDIPERFVDIPQPLNYSILCFHFTRPSSVPKTFGWFTGPGVLFGEIDVTGKAGEDSVTYNTKLLPYPKDKDDTQPVDLVLTEFHILLLFQDRLKVICALNEQLVFEDVYSETFGKMVGITKDPVKGTIWTYSEMAVYKYKIINESRNVWEIYLEKGDFENAKLFCKDHPENMDAVTLRQAEKLFEEKNYEESAMLYAQTHSSFEQIALKFLEINESDALTTFLLKKLENLKQNDKTQISMIVLWLIELFLNKIGTIRDAGQAKSSEYDNLQQSFHKFLCQDKIKASVSNNKTAVYDLISSHGDQEDLIFFAIQMKDFEKVIRYHIQHGNYEAALLVLSKQTNVELIYQFSPSLMQVIPKQTIDLLISLGRKMNPSQLIPALVQYVHPVGSNKTNEAIRYLEFCVHTMDNKEQPIHTYLLAMYAHYQPDKLMTYLNFQGQDSFSICYDLKYALRLCSELEYHQACVHIYATMGLFEEAVDLALKVDVELAKQNANRPEDDEDLRKKLWLKIAKHIVKEKKDIKTAMEFLQECDLVKIEDILPFFPDFVTIDHFKDAICASLQEYNEHIEDLKNEMDEATKKAQEIRTEIQLFRNKYTFVQGHDKCSACSYPVMTRSFYLFPCRHLFHSDCLISEVLPQLTGSRKIRVEEIQRQLASVSNKEDTISVNSQFTGVGRREQLKAELDDLIAAECLYCGEIMIRCIDRPFIEADEYEQVMRGWD